LYKIIIVEDEALIRKGLRFSINWEEYGTTVVGEAENGKKGLELIEKTHPDIVITDVNMPLMSGIDMIKESIVEYKYQSIIISGFDEFDFIKEAMTVGSVDYLLKPFSTENLIDAILKAIKKIKQEQLYELSSNVSERVNEFTIPLTMNVEDRVVNEMLQYVRNNYDKKVRLSDVSQFLNYSETSLKRRFKATMTTTFNNYLNTYRIKKAIELGTNSDYSIQEISARCGFTDYKYFSVVFKKFTNFNAMEFFQFIKKD